MHRTSLLAATLALSALSPAQTRIPAPEEITGHKPGERYTPHALIVRYADALAAAAPTRARVVRYGKTAGGRDLLLLQLTAERHMRELPRIQQDLASLVAGGVDAGPIVERLPAVAWLSFNVHGNEASPSETALTLAHRLLTDPEDQRLLDDLIVVIDPCLNPDGRDRFAHWFEDVVGMRPDPNPDAIEHDEPWPGGRFNHYRFDLNRDWAFMTQDETRGRIARYLELPAQVHVDFHEMGNDSTYFFFPAAQPVNQHVDRRVLRWQKEFGRGNATAFDGQGWRYYTAESFDLFYPGYGDSWPSLMGAAGMTYEMAGHSRSGRAVRREDGTVLTLKDRIDRHLLAARATLQTAARNRAALLADFHRIHRDSEEAGRRDRRPYWLVPEADDPGRAAALVQLLVAQGIQVERATTPVLARDVVRPGQPPRDVDRFAAGTYRLALIQPRGRLAATLMEADPAISHLYFYDVSAWSLPMAFGLLASRAATTEGTFAPVTAPPAPRTILPDGAATPTYAWAIPWHVGDGPVFLQRLIDQGLLLRFIERRVEVDGHTYEPGTVLVFRGEQAGDPLARIRAAAEGLTCRVDRISTGLTERGPDLGSHTVERLFRPAIALVEGPGTDSSGSGAIWFLFERRLGIPVTRVAAEHLGGVNLDRFNVLVLPSGGTSGIDAARLRAWIARGNVAIGIAGGADGLARALELRAPPEKPGDKPAAAAESRAWRTIRDDQEERRRKSRPGAIVEVKLDPDHVLSAGYPEAIPVLASGDRGFPLEGFGRTVGFYGEGVRLGGYMPGEVERSYVGTGYLNHVPVGRGSAVLFHQDPHFRLVWHGLTRLFLNACFLLPRRDAQRDEPPATR